MSVSRRKTELNQKLKKLQKQVVDGPAGPHLRACCDRMVAERKDWIVVSLAQQVVRSVDGLYLLEEIIRNGMTGWLKPIHSLDEWEQMYRRPCPANRAVLVVGLVSLLARIRRIRQPVAGASGNG